MHNEQYSVKEHLSAGVHGFKHFKVCSGFFCLSYKLPLLFPCWLISLTSSPAMHSYPNYTPGRNCLWLIRTQMKAVVIPNTALIFAGFSLPLPANALKPWVMSSPRCHLYVP